MERNTLMAKCYPRIKDYCREKHGLEFQVLEIFGNFALCVRACVENVRRHIRGMA